MHRSTIAFLAAGSLVLTAGCSGSGSCKSACKKIAQCLGIDASTPTSDGATSLDGGADATKDVGTKSDNTTGWTCPLSEKCTTTEACYAKCINKASCDAITGKDADGSSAMVKCQADCDKTGADAALFDAGPLDGKPSDQKTDQKQDACVPDCTDRECGSNGCGGSCGSCYSPKVCNTTSGQCVTSCTASCSGKQCGDDGCSGSCGSCGSGYFCNSYYQCEKTCTPSCSNKQCGNDGCGGSCGTCPYNYYCDTYTFQCKSNCTPSCSGKQCGDNGCGGSCGTCPSPAICSTSGVCQPPGQCTTVDYTFSSSSLSPVTETHTDSTVKWQISSYRYHSASYALYYGNPSTLTFAGAGTNSGLAILPSVTVPTTGTSNMTFWLYMDTETGTTYDVLKVLFGGTTLWTKSSSTVMKSWQQITVPFSSVAGQTSEIVFSFTTIDGSGNDTEGVYVDDISIQLGCP